MSSGSLRRSDRGGSSGSSARGGTRSCPRTAATPCAGRRSGTSPHNGPRNRLLLRVRNRGPLRSLPIPCNSLLLGAPDARALAERGVGERVQRLVQVPQLPCQQLEALRVLRVPVQAGELVADPVEPLEHRLELPVGHLLCVHRQNLARAPRLGARPPRLPPLRGVSVGDGRRTVHTNVFFGLLIASILLAVYDVADAMAYVWLAQGLLAVVASFGPSWSELALRIRSGDIATDLYRPVDLQRALFAQDVGRAGYQALWRAAPQFVLGALLYEIATPGSALRWLAFGLSVCLAIVVSFAVRFLVNLTAFWLLDYRGPQVLVLTAAHLLSGLIIPLSYFPEPFGDIARALPFAAMLQTPIDIYVNEPLGGSTVGVLLLQVFWATTLVLCGRLVLAAGTRKLVVQGG